MHESWRECPECEGEYDEGKACYRCGGAGVLEYEVPVRPPEFASCPKCGALMARRRESDGAVFCRKCDGYVKPYEHDAVLNDPKILER